jgi:low affinity Fe/Cu permease
MFPLVKLGARQEREGPAMTDSSTSRPGRWQRYRVGPRVEQRTTGSRWLYRVDHYSSLPIVAVSVVVVIVGAFVVGLVLGFPNGWIIAFESGASAVTLAMVFVIQHTQSREQAATQRKLDELLRAIPEAQSDLIMLEEASEETMREVEEGQRDLKRQQ